jgi:hypothetical protein
MVRADALSGIKAPLQAELGFSSADYAAVVAFYAFPNPFLLMAVLGGIALDRFRIRRTGSVFTALCAAGVFVTAYGASDAFRGGGPLHGPLRSLLPEGTSPGMAMMIAGRLLFGPGAETSIVVIN